MSGDVIPAALRARLVEVLSECHQLQGTEDPVEQPYKSLYAAADVLETLISELQAAPAQQQQEAASADLQALRAEASAWARCLRGIALLQTDLLHDGEAELTAGMAHTWSDSCYSHALRSRALNALGALCQERSKHTEAQQHLEAALNHYQAAKTGPWASADTAGDTAPQQTSGSSSSKDAGGAPAAPAAATPSSCCSASSALEALHAVLAAASGMTPAYLEQHHSLTLVTLAQVAAAQGQAAASASFCAAGLNSYLATGAYAAQLDEWVQNCLQLGAYYIDTRAWGAAAYCQAAVAALLTRHDIDPAAVVAASVQKEEQQQRAASPDASPASGSDQQQGSSSSGGGARPQHHPAAAAAAAGQQGTDAGAAADGSQYPSSASKEVPPGAANTTHQQNDGQPSTAASGDSSAAPPHPQLRLSADVAANVLLAAGKLRMARLAASHAVAVEGRPREEAAKETALPAELSFTGLADALPLPGTLPCGTGALVGDYPGALGLAQGALRAFRGAASYYRLDGWVTEHVRLLFDMSNVYRLLAGFESDPHRACVTHRHRAKLLSPLEGQLSPVHFLGLVRSLHLELGNVARCIHEIKEAAGWPAAKVAATGRQAAVQYQRFLDTYAPPGAPTPKDVLAAAASSSGGSSSGMVWEVPEGLAAEDQEAYLGACFSLGRVLHKCSAAEGDVAPLLASLARLRGAAAYVSRHRLAAWEREAALAQELADLVAAKVDMTRQLAAMRGAGLGAGAGGKGRQLTAVL